MYWPQPTFLGLRPFEAGQGTAGLTTKKPNKDILEHDRKRQIELKLVILEDKLTEQGYTESEIADKLAEARKALEAQQEKDEEEEGEVLPIHAHQRKFSDTQTHQIAARKEKQMETFRAALGIGLSESGLPPLPNSRKNNNDEDKREHAFLDRDPPVVTADLEVVDPQGKIDESRHQKKEKKRSRHHDSDTDTDSSVEHSSKASRKGYVSESESDDHASGKKQKKSDKKHDRRRPLDSDDSHSDKDNDDTGRRDVHDNKSSRKRHDSSEDDSDTDGGREKKKGEVLRRKIEPTRSQRRGRDTMGSESDSDADRARDHKMETVKKGCHRHDSSEDDYDRDGGREKTRGEVQKRKIELTGSQRRKKDNMGSESDSHAERARERKKETVQKGRHRHDSSEDDSDGGRGKKRGEVRRRNIELTGSRRRGRDNLGSESDSDAHRARDHKKETVKKGGHRYDKEDDSCSDISDEQVEKGRGRGRRYDSDVDEDSNSSYGGKSVKNTTPTERAARRRSVSLTDDTSSSDDGSDSSDLKHQAIGKKNAVGKDRTGNRGDDYNRGVRGSHQSSQEEKGFVSSAAKNDDRRGRTLNEDDRSERLQKSEENRDMIKGKRKLDDESHIEQPEPKSRSRNLEREVERKRYNPKDTKFEFESNAKAYREKDDQNRDEYSRWGEDDRKRDEYSRWERDDRKRAEYSRWERDDRKRAEYSRWEKDDQKRDDYSRSVRSGGELDGDNGRHPGRIQSKISKPHSRSKRNDKDYEDGKGGQRHRNNEEEPQGREHERDEIYYKYRSNERDEEEHHGKL